MQASGITITTVGVATHGGNENSHMQDIADAAPPKKGEKGHYYNVTDPTKLPAIYIQESRLVSQSFAEEKAFLPEVLSRSGPTEGLPDPLKKEQHELLGYVRTTKKPGDLAHVSIQTPPFADQQFPLLAEWKYGLGKAVAFTSSAGFFLHDDGTKYRWDSNWDASGMYDRFWQRVVDWSLRPTESSRLRMVAEYKDGVITITVDAQTETGDPDTDLTVRGRFTPPHPGADDAPRRQLRFVQKNSGRYVATVEAEDPGSYFLSAQAFHKDGSEVSVPPAAVTLPYSREFAEPETHADKLERLRDITGGISYTDSDAAWWDGPGSAAATGQVFRPVPPPTGGSQEAMQPVWPWFLLAAALLLFADVAVRRVSVDWQKAREFAWRSWLRLRGIPRPPDQPDVLDRLLGRWAATAAAIDRGRAARRFEAAGEYTPAPPGRGRPGPSRRRRAAPGRRRRKAAIGAGRVGAGSGRRRWRRLRRGQRPRPRRGREQTLIGLAAVRRTARSLNGLPHGQPQRNAATDQRLPPGVRQGPPRDRQGDRRPLRNRPRRADLPVRRRPRPPGRSARPGQDAAGADAEPGA